MAMMITPVIKDGSFSREKSPLSGYSFQQNRIGMMKPVIGLVVLPTTVSESPKEERKSEKAQGMAAQNKVTKKFALKLMRNIFLSAVAAPSEGCTKEIEL